MISHHAYSGFFCLFPDAKVGERYVLAGPRSLPGTESLILDPGGRTRFRGFPMLQTFVGKILQGSSQQVL
jgi:hypothetical protein